MLTLPLFVRPRTWASFRTQNTQQGPYLAFDSLRPPLLPPFSTLFFVETQRARVPAHLCDCLPCPQRKKKDKKKVFGEPFIKTRLISCSSPLDAAAKGAQSLSADQTEILRRICKWCAPPPGRADDSDKAPYLLKLAECPRAAGRRSVRRT